MIERITGVLTVRKQRFALVASRFNEYITSRLVAGAVEALRRHGAADDQITEVWVPGAWELALAARALIEKGGLDAVICLGCVIRGQTTHHEHVGGQAARALAHLALERGVPVAFGVLTTDTVEQAVERAGGKLGNKGAEAALSAIEMVNVLAQIRGLHRPGT